MLNKNKKSNFKNLLINILLFAISPISYLVTNLIQGYKIFKFYNLVVDNRFYLHPELLKDTIILKKTNID